MSETTVKVVQAKWLEKLPPLRVQSCLWILAAALAAFYPLVAVVAYALRGSDALLAAAVAAGLCYLGGVLTLVATDRLGRQGPNGPLFTLLAGMVFNVGLPFAGGLLLYRQGGLLAQGGVFGLTVVFFEFTLVVATLLSLCLIKSPR